MTRNTLKKPLPVSVFEKTEASSGFFVPVILLLICLTLIFTSNFAYATERLTILHFNDLHGYIDSPKNSKLGGVDGMATLIKDIEDKNKEKGHHTIILFGGDAFSGTAVSSLFKGAAEFAFFNAIGLDAFALGNHDFDFGLPILEKRIEEANFPTLGANVMTGNRIWNGLKKNVIINLSPNLKVGLLGVMRKTTPVETKRSTIENIKFTDPISAVRKELKEIKERTDVQIALAHMGLDGCEELATKVRGLDLVVGGHSHVSPNNYCKKAGEIFFCQTPANGKYLGRIDLTIDGDKVEMLSNKLIPVDKEIRPNQDTKKILEQFRKKTRFIESKVIGRATKKIPKSIRLGKMIANAFKKTANAEIGIINFSGIRAPINKGEITIGKMFEVLPFENQIVKMRVRGNFLEKIIKHMVDPKRGRRLVFSGLTFRAKKGEVTSIHVNRKPLDKKRFYTIATVDFLAEGGSGYWEFTKVKEQQVLSVLMRDSFTAYIKEKKTIP